MIHGAVPGLDFSRFGKLKAIEAMFPVKCKHRVRIALLVVGPLNSTSCSTFRGQSLWIFIFTPTGGEQVGKYVTHIFALLRALELIDI